MTQRLYYEDSYCTEFDAQVVQTLPGHKGAIGVILDRTCFYPTSGGQPCDHGTLEGQTVLDATEERGEVVHWIAGKLPSPSVRGRIIWSRRFDHMQQHTGQHILSQAFLRTLGANTVGFHMGEEASTIDLDRPTLQAREADDVESLANEVVFANKPVHIRLVGPNEALDLGLRKQPAVDQDIRIVEIEGFDLSPCGGTHCSRTGEIGTIAIRRWERRGQETRVEFLCGWRALRDHRWKTAMVNELALAFSVGDHELADAVRRLMQEAAVGRREVHRLQEEAMAAEAQRLLNEADTWHGVRVVRRAFEDRDPQEVRRLATLLSEAGQTIALLGVGGAQARLVFARSEDLDIDMSALLRHTCTALGGRGGGQPHLAQGGGLPGETLGDALQLAYRTLTTP